MANGPSNPKKNSVNIKDLKKLIDLMRKAELTEVDIEQEGLKIKLRKGKEPQVTVLPAAAPAPVVLGDHPPSTSSGRALPPPPAPPAVPAAPAAPAPAAGGLSINSPMVGTFYAAPAPDAPTFVKEGDRVEVGKTVCVIEAMKLMNEIKAEVAGRVTKVLVENAQPVEYGQPLFIVEPI
jgi:acetyl-CoA carboxylase biotin carboxyl carrier protein